MSSPLLARPERRPTMSRSAAPSFQEALEIVESLPEDQQESLVNILRRRQTERRRDLLAQNIAKARAEHERGEAVHGSVDDLMRELEECES
jgi:hypothetical protein